MTATDRLRALLDERGVEYETDDHMGYSETRWDDACAFQLAPGAGLVMAVTPEQAVEVTLGRGECHNVHEPPKDTSFWPSPHFKCSECGEAHVSMQYVYYCPNCGRKVEE